MVERSRSIADAKCLAASSSRCLLHRLDAALVLEKRENRLIPRLRVRTAQVDQLLPDAVRVVPLMLLFVQLLQVEQGVLVLRIEPQHFVERFERAIDEPAALEVEAQAQQDVGVLDARELRPLQQRLVNLDRARHLAALAIDVAENQMNLERVGVDARRLAQLLDRDIDLIGRPGS